MKSLWQLRVKPEKPPKAGQLPSGIWLPDLVDTYDHGQRKTRNELRPLQGTVTASPVNGFWAMHDEVEYRRSRFSMAHGVRLLTDAGRMPIPPSPMMRVPWRMPEEGDTVWFGYMSWIWEREPQFMWPGEVYWVVPQNGEPYALGDWCIVEQITEESVSASGIVLSATPGTELGRGVVRAVGDGFAMQKPGILPGMTVLFKVFGARNPEVRNPFGEGNATRIRPSQLVAIDNCGVTDADLQRRNTDASEISRDMPRGYLGAIDPNEVESGKQMAAGDLARAQKRHNDVRYYGKRMKHH